MKSAMRAVTMVTGLAVAAVAGGGRALAEEDPWQLRVGAVAARGTSGDLDETSYGGGLGFEYRLAPYLGVELAALSADLKAEETFTSDDETDRVKESVGMVPLMAKLDFHLTPNSRADFYVSPLAAYVLMGDLKVRERFEEGGEVDTFEQHVGTKDKLTWGLGVGLDVPLGHGSSFLSLAATYLKLPLELRLAGFGDDDGDFRVHIDPVTVQIGYGLRF
jgi:outer membrane protein W